MKQNAIFSFLFCCLVFQLQAQQATNFYTIQLGAFLNPSIDDFKTIRPLGHIYAEQMSDQLQQIYIGGFSDEVNATKTLDAVKRKGYPDAFVSKRSFKNGKDVTVIQLAVKTIEEPIEWNRFADAGKLYTIVYGNKVKIVTGLFANNTIAQSNIGRIKALGFKDAFIKKVNSVEVHKVSTFEAENLTSYKEKVIAIKEEIIPDELPEEFESRGAIPDAVPIPDDYTIIRFNKKGLPATEVPTIRSNVKRRSVMALQRSLKTEKAYTGSIDGLYGNGTKGAFEQVMLEHKQLQKYQFLTSYYYTEKTASEAGSLQFYIDELGNRPSLALNGLAQSTHPLAKAYQAYALFLEGRKETRVNELMNTAIKETFQGKQLKNQPPFDYRATYAYDNLDQLILHLSYIQTASDKELAAPCWLFSKHPTETLKAFEPFDNFSADNYKVETCKHFLDWSEMELLYTIAVDLNAKTTSKERINNHENVLARLYHLAKPLSDEDSKRVNAWTDDLLQGMQNWATQSVLNEQVLSAFKITYYQSQVRLEDFYMDKGFNKTEAEMLAIYALQQLLEPYLESYL